MPQKPLVLYITGDGGWRGKDLATFNHLIGWGYPVVGVVDPGDLGVVLRELISEAAHESDTAPLPSIEVVDGDDGLEFHNQLFLPRDLKAGERRPAIIFVHGGPIRQMLLGYHYRYVYHQFYAANEWLASKGYVVSCVNFHGSTGFGQAFTDLVVLLTEGRGGRFER